MSDQTDPLGQFSNALAARADAAKGTVVAIRLAHERHVTGMLWQSGIVVTSEQALPIGANGAGGVSARLGLVNLAGPEWHSSRGGLIDRRIVLDVRLAHREEGGPVFDATGNCLGMSTFGPRGQVIAIPTATIERIVPQLLKDGRVARGWLGVALQALAVPG